MLFRGNPHSPSDPVEPAFPAIFAESAPTIPEAPTSQSIRRTKTRVGRVDHGSGESIDRSRDGEPTCGSFISAGASFDRATISDSLGRLRPIRNCSIGLPLRLVDGGWKLKSMHRLIMTSRAYQMSSEARDDAMAVDPNNDSFWRFDPRRLSAEEVRDSILAVNKSLNRQLYGPSIYPTLSKEVLAGQSRPGSGWGNSSEEERNRRSVYIHVKRSLLNTTADRVRLPRPGPDLRRSIRNAATGTSTCRC